MSSKKMHVKRTRPRKGAASARGPPIASISYRGSLVASDVKDGQPIAVNINTYSSMGTTSIAGVATFNSTFTAANITGATDFTDWSSLYQEFRILGIEYTFLPTDQNTATPYLATAVQSPFFLLPYHGDASAIISTTNAQQHAPFSVKCLNQPQKIAVKMNEADEAQWFSVSSGTVPIMGLKTWFTASTTGATDVYYFGTLLIRGLVQFRGRVVSATQMSKTLTKASDGNDAKKSVGNDSKQKDQKSDEKEWPILVSPSDSFSQGKALGKTVNEEYVLLQKLNEVQQQKQKQILKIKT